MLVKCYTQIARLLDWPIHAAPDGDRDIPEDDPSGYDQQFGLSSPSFNTLDCIQEPISASQAVIHIIFNIVHVVKVKSCVHAGVIMRRRGSLDHA